MLEPYHTVLFKTYKQNEENHEKKQIFLLFIAIILITILNCNDELTIILMMFANVLLSINESIN
jgi:hypothetical protein